MRPCIWHATSQHSRDVPACPGNALEVAQAQLGHSDLATTLEVYTHASVIAQREAVNLLESQLFPKRLAPAQKRWHRQLIEFSRLSGAPREIRTPDLLLRRRPFSRWPTQNEQVRRAVVGNRWLHWAGLGRFCSTICATPLEMAPRRWSSYPASFLTRSTLELVSFEIASEVCVIVSHNCRGVGGVSIGRMNCPSFSIKMWLPKFKPAASESV